MTDQTPPRLLPPLRTARNRTTSCATSRHSISRDRSNSSGLRFQKNCSPHRRICGPPTWRPCAGRDIARSRPHGDAQRRLLGHGANHNVGKIGHHLSWHRLSVHSVGHDCIWTSMNAVRFFLSPCGAFSFSQAARGRTSTRRRAWNQRRNRKSGILAPLERLSRSRKNTFEHSARMTRRAAPGVWPSLMSRNSAAYIISGPSSHGP